MQVLERWKSEQRHSLRRACERLTSQEPLTQVNTHGFQTLESPLLPCVALGMCLNLSKASFPTCKTMLVTSASYMVQALNERMQAESLAQWRCLKTVLAVTRGRGGGQHTTGISE